MSKSLRTTYVIAQVVAGVGVFGVVTTFRAVRLVGEELHRKVAGDE